MQCLCEGVAGKKNTYRSFKTLNKVKSVPDVPLLLPGFLPHSFSFSCVFKLTFSSLSLSRHPLKPLLLWNSLTITPVSPLSFHPLTSSSLSVFLICHMTRHISASDISLSEAREPHAALRVAENLQIHTHALYLCLLTSDTCRGVYVLNNTAEPTS